MMLAAKTRFIPARAGNTAFVLRRGKLISVHPRACGEHPAAIAGEHRNVGSSPRVRGTQTGRAGIAAHRRFIPARAGNTTARWSRCIV